MKKSESNIIPKNQKRVKFTQRQLQVINLWAECDNAEKIAQNLGLSVHTVRTQLKRMRRKLGVSRTFQVYQFVQEEKERK